VVTIAFYAAFLLTAADVAFMSRGRRFALLTTAVLAAPPVAFTVWTTKMHTFAETGEASFVLFWVALRLVQSQEPRRKLLWAAALGLGAGIGLWWSYLVVIYLVPAGLVVLTDAGTRRPPFLAVALAMAVLGAGPALYRNAVVTHWATFVHAAHPDASQARSGQPDHAVPAIAIKNLTGIALPAFLGFHDARTTPYRWSAPASLVDRALAALALLGIGVCGWEILRPDQTRLARWATAGPLVGGVTMVALYVCSRFGFEPEPRYLMPLYPAVGFMNAWGIDCLFRQRREVGAVALAGLLVFQFQRTFLVEPAVVVAQWNPKAPANVSYRALAERLVALGKTHIVTDYWTSVRLTFESDEQVIATDPRSERHPPYLQEVRSDPRACYLEAKGPHIDRMAAAHPDTVRFEFGTDIPGIGQPLTLLCPR
jgi:hypothetical protein